MAQKTQKVQLKGTPHDFEFKQDSNENEKIYVCKNCEIEGIQFKKNKYVEVFINRKTKKLIETCKKSDVVTFPQKLRLPVKYNPEQLNEYGKKLADELYNVDMIKEEKAAADSGFKARIDAALESASKYANAIRKGQEEIEVECEVKLHFPEMHKKTITRKDTNEIIYQDIMLDDDYDLFKGQEGQSPEPENVHELNDSENKTEETKENEE